MAYEAIVDVPTKVKVTVRYWSNHSVAGQCVEVRRQGVSNGTDIVEYLSIVEAEFIHDAISKIFNHEYGPKS
jgi:hypothetical protein